MKKIKNAIKNYFEKYGVQITASCMMMNRNLNAETLKSLSKSMKVLSMELQKNKRKNKGNLWTAAMNYPCFYLLLFDTAGFNLISCLDLLAEILSNSPIAISIHSAIILLRNRSKSKLRMKKLKPRSETHDYYNRQRIRKLRPHHRP